MAHDREVAGIRCMQVLEDLSDFVDGVLEAARADQIRSHLEGCEWCENFGGRYRQVVRRLRSHGSEEEGRLKAGAERLARVFEED